MSFFILAYTATAYLFSGSVCYVASRKDSQPQAQKSSLNSIVSLWVVMLWPLWVLKAINQEDNLNQTTLLEESVQIERELVAPGKR
jgi:hypothetical protein